MSNLISFWTEVKTPCIWRNIAESYWSPLCNKAAYILIRGRHQYEMYDAIVSELTVLKVLAYATSVIPYLAYGLNRLSLRKAVAISLVIPAYTLLMKGQTRFLVSRLYLVERPTKEQWVGYSGAEGETRHLNGNEQLDFNVKYQMSYDQVYELFLERPGRNHLPKGNNAIYSTPPVIYWCTTKLNEYQDSYFETEWKGTYNPKTDELENEFFEVVRRKKVAELLQPNQPHSLNIDDVVDLALVPIREGVAISLRPEYTGSKFSYEKDLSNGKYTIRIESFMEEYPRIPFNMPLLYENNRLEALKLTRLGEHNNLVGDMVWTSYSSSIEEYSSSVFLVKIKDSNVRVVRMLKPKTAV